MNRKQFLQFLGTGTIAIGTGSLSATTRHHGAAMPGLGTQNVPRGSWPRKNWAWVNGDFDSIEPWKPQFDRWRAAGIDAILMRTGEVEELERFIPAASAAGLETHAWISTLMRRGLEADHPEWYAVNRKGESTATHPPYVEYYRFLCPCREPVRRHLAEHVASLSAIENLGSVHLDYIRYPDVILPRSLWEKYDLVQDREHPEFDYCYCDECRRQFIEQTGDDPAALPDPPSNEAWLQFRYDSITRVVNELAAVVHGAGKQVTAAVFPTPDIARALVRQDWVRWNVDALLPMLYHSFYLEPVEWIEQGTRQGVEALDGRLPLYAGLYVPELDPEELGRAVRAALAGGASGVSLFEANKPTEPHWEEFARAISG